MLASWAGAAVQRTTATTTVWCLFACPAHAEHHAPGTHLQAHFAAHHHGLRELLHYILDQACGHRGDVIGRRGPHEMDSRTIPAGQQPYYRSSPSPLHSARPAAPEWSGSVWDTST